MSLCSTCQQVDIAHLFDEEDVCQRVPYHKSISDLEKGAQHCHLCRLVWATLSPVVAPHLNESSRNTPVDLFGRVHGHSAKFHDDDDFAPYWYRRFGGIYLMCSLVRTCMKFTVFAKESDPISMLLHQKGLISRPIKHSEDSMPLVRRWIHDCEASHTLCSTLPEGPGPLPTRVLDVGAGPDSGPRLVIPSSGELGYYVALSHCWGAEPGSVIRTTTDTINEHMKRIPFSHLPQNFQDAVKITRLLDIRYLWIDSLCIIQNSLEDWERESMKMGTVYASAYVTIAAVASHTSDGGCFRYRGQEEYPEVKFSHVSESGKKECAKVFIRPEDKNFRDLEDCPLQSRAWVTQERLLSRRTLHFAQDQILFECRESRQAEDGIPSDLKHLDHWDGRLAAHYPRKMPNGALREFFWDYYRLIQNYTTRGLTNPQDKLPALSGLAKEMEARTGFTYVAGLWQEHLAYGLLWRRPGYGRSSIHLVANRAPSWSWAAWDGQITMMLQIFDFVPVVKDLQVDLVPEGQDPRGRLESGRLSLTGRLVAVDPRSDPQSDAWKSISTAQKIDRILQKDRLVGQAIYDSDYSSPSTHLLFCLKLLEYKERWFGLLLETTSQQDEFVRVGFAEDGNFYKDFQDLSYDLFSGVESRRITII